MYAKDVAQEKAAIAAEQQAIIDENAWKEEDNGTMAYIQLRNHVKEQLKSPSTAKFPFFDWVSTKTENQTYFVKSYVDSQNSFGATVRTEFVGLVQQIGKYDWVVIDVKYGQ
jgi:hypothetical protein